MTSRVNRSMIRRAAAPGDHGSLAGRVHMCGARIAARAVSAFVKQASATRDRHIRHPAVRGDVWHGTCMALPDRS
jgi:hypothetical protein